MLLTLNTDILALICLKLDNFALRNLLVSCKYLNHINQQNHLWFKLISLIKNNKITHSTLLLPSPQPGALRSYYLKNHFYQRLYQYVDMTKVDIDKVDINTIIIKYTNFVDLFNSTDFDIFLFSLCFYNTIHNIDYNNDKFDRRDNFANFFKLISVDRVKKIIINSDLLTIVNIQRKYELTNINLVKLKITNTNFISNTQYAKAIIDSYNNDDMIVFNFLYQHCKNNDSKFINIFALTIMDQDQFDLFDLLCQQDLDLFKLLQDYGLTINASFYGYIINNYHITFLKYFDFLLTINIKSCFRLYNKINILTNLNCYGQSVITDIKYVLFDYLFNLPISKYRTTEDKIVRDLQSIINSFTKAEEFDQLYYLSQSYLSNIT